MLKPNLFSILLAILLAAQLAQSRLQLLTIRLPLFRRDGCWSFIDRLHLDPGSMSIQSTAKLLLNNIKHGAVYTLQLVAIPQQLWQTSLQAKCNDHNYTAQELHLKQTKEFVLEFRLDANNLYSATVSSRVEVPAQQSYHFVLRDCSKVLINEGYDREAKIDFSLDVRNNNSHLSASEDHYAWLLPLLLLAESALLWFLAREHEEEGDNWIKLLLKISLWLALASILFRYLGYLVYAHVSGIDHGVFDFFYLLLHSGSDSLLLVLVMLLSYGWTVTFKNGRDFDLYVPLACMVGLLNIVMTMLNKITDGEHDKHHMFDSIPAYIMLGFRTLAFLVYLVGISHSWLHSPKPTPKLTSYLYQLTLLGFLYTTFVPIAFVAITFVSNRFKKEAMFFTIELTRFALSAWLAWLAGSKKSAYRSLIDGSFMEKAEKFY